MKWRYSIRLENTSGSRIQLRQRHWRIFSSSGTLETVRGDGVIGQVSVITSYKSKYNYLFIPATSIIYSTACLSVQ